MICNICRSNAVSSFETLDRKKYWSCNVCGGKYLDKSYFIDTAEEELRYLEHNNDIQDKEYINQKLKEGKDIILSVSKIYNRITNIINKEL